MEQTNTDIYRQRALEAQYHIWHPKLKHLCFKSTTVKLSRLFTHKYLLADGVYQPEDDPEYSEQSDEESETDKNHLLPEEK